MAGKHKRPLSAGCALILTFFCLAAAGLFYLAIDIPRRAQADFGAPNSQLSQVQQFLYAFRIVTEKNDLLTSLVFSTEERDFEIAQGESANSVAYRLEREGFIRNYEAFRNFMVYSGLDTSIQAGSYRLSPGWTALQIAYQLQDATPETVDFLVFAGWRAEEVANSLQTSGLDISVADFMEAVHHPPAEWLPESLKGLDSLEGYLFPGSYEFQRSATLRDVMTAMLNRFDQSVTAEMRAAYGANGLSLTEAVTMASIVQREGVDPNEHSLIASVFFNRLAAGMRLESDPTTQYALGYNENQQTWWTNPLTYDDLAVNSAYNTYQVNGLPPGPISNPGLNALQAVAKPAQTPYYYFRAKCDGSGDHEFATTYDEHLQNACP